MSGRVKILSKRKQKKRARRLDRAFERERVRRLNDRLHGREYD